MVDNLPDQGNESPLTGGPGSPPETKQGPDQVTPKPTGTPIKFGEREFVVPTDVGSAWKDREDEFLKRLSDQGQELGELRKFKEEQVNHQTPQQFEPYEGASANNNEAIDDLMFSDPTVWRQRITDQLKTEIREEYTQYENKKEQISQFWNDFYTSNEDLKGMDYFVDAILNRNHDAWQHLPTDEVRTRLADSAREELVRINQKFSSGKDANSRTVVEGGNTNVPQVLQGGPDENKPGGSLSELIQARQEARRSGTRAVTS